MSWLERLPDPGRWQRALKSSHTATVRLEVWSDGEQLSEAAPFQGGQVTDEWVTGIRRSLSTTLPPTRSWMRWLDRPALELRPYRGVRLSRSTTWEVPLGRFPLLPPEISRPAGPIPVSCNDYMQRVSSAPFTGPTAAPGGRIVDRIAWMLAGAGLPAPEIRATSGSTAPSTVVDGDRDQEVAASANTVEAEVFADRDGVPVIENARQLGVTTAVLGRLGSVLKPDWSKVYNVVAVSSSAPDVEFPPQTVGITWPDHPASPYRLGSSRYPSFRVYSYSSPLISTQAQAVAIARSLLPKVSRRARTVQYVDVVDPTLDAGDSVFGNTPTGLEVAQIQSVTTPLEIASGGRAVPQVTVTAFTELNG